MLIEAFKNIKSGVSGRKFRGTGSMERRTVGDAFFLADKSGIGPVEEEGDMVNWVQRDCFRGQRSWTY